MADNKNKQGQNQGQQNHGDDAAAAAKKAAEDAELERLLKEDAEKAANEAAEKAAASNPAPRIEQNSVKVGTASRPASPIVVGDVKVQCIRSCNHVSLGSRHYVFVAGKEISMDPSHALEMEQAGWVVARK